MKTIPIVPVIDAAAKRNGIVAANERPNTAISTSSAIGSAMPSPFARSFERIGSRSCSIAGCPLTYASTPGGGRTLRRMSSV